MKNRTYNILKSIKITKDKYFFFYLYVMFTRGYPGHRYHVSIGRGKYFEYVFDLSLSRKIEYIDFQIGIRDNRNLPF